VAEFQAWSGFRISIKKSLVTGALYGREELVRNAAARKESSHRKATGKRERESTLAQTQRRELIDPDSSEHAGENLINSSCPVRYQSNQQ